MWRAGILWSFIRVTLETLPLLRFPNSPTFRNEILHQCSSTEDLQPYYDGLGCGDVVTEGTFNLDTAVAVFDPNDVTPELDGNTTDSDGSLAITLGASAGGGGLLLFIILVAVNHMQKGDDKTSTGDNEKGDVENQIAVLSSGNELEGASSPQLAGNELGEFTEDPNIGSAVV